MFWTRRLMQYPATATDALVHRASFQCAPTIAAESSASATLDAPHAAHRVELFGEFSSNWDVTVDLNSPCLVLPQQFFDSVSSCTWT